jgi:acyl-coenzyme A synthetase/AMP-(fatty) acid ligase
MQHGSRQVTTGQAATEQAAGQAAAPTFAGPTLTTAVLGAIGEHMAGRADRPALIDAVDGRSLTYAEMASVVPAAGAGLARRGVRTGDVAAVYVAGARDLALAVHALAAAGAVPAPMPPTASADELAARLTEYGARLLITAPPLAEAAIAAADRSYVRQVFALSNPAFDDVTGATGFGGLLGGGGPRPHIDPLRDHALLVSGGPGDGLGDGPPRRLTHADRLAGLYRLAARTAVAAGDVLVAASAGCPTTTWLGLVDVALLRGATFVAVTRAGSAPLLRAIETYGATLAAVSPATLTALARDGAVMPHRRVGTGLTLRVLVTGPAPADVVRACRRRYDWSIEALR